MTKETNTLCLGKMGYVKLTKDQIDPKNKKWMRAFVRTDGESKFILATLSERNRDPVPVSISCGARNYKGQHGVLVTAVFQEMIPNDLELQVVIFQPDANTYEAPVFYPEL